MSEDFEKRLDFDSDTFEELKKNMNFVLQCLIGNMQEKGINEDSMTLNLEGESDYELSKVKIFERRGTAGA